MFELYDNEGQLINLNTFTSLRFLGKLNLSDYVNRNRRTYWMGGKDYTVPPIIPDHPKDELYAFRGYIGLNSRKNNNSYRDIPHGMFISPDTEIYRFSTTPLTNAKQPYGLEIRDVNNNLVFNLAEGYAQIVNVVNLSPLYGYGSPSSAYALPLFSREVINVGKNPNLRYIHQVFEQSCHKYDNLPYGEYAVMLTGLRAYDAVYWEEAEVIRSGHEIIRTTPYGFWYGFHEETQRFHYNIPPSYMLYHEAAITGISINSAQTILVIDVSNLD